MTDWKVTHLEPVLDSKTPKQRASQASREAFVIARQEGLNKRNAALKAKRAYHAALARYEGRKG